MSIMSYAYMKMFPMEAKEKKSADMSTPVLDISEFRKAWELHMDTRIDIVKRFEYLPSKM